MPENNLIRFCPNCHTERPLTELFCEGTVGSAPCEWNLMIEPIRSVGWRPAPVIPIEPTTPIAPLVCTNRHPMEDGDLMCSVCGADAASATDPAEQTETLPVEPNEPTVIAGWRVLRQISKADGLKDRFLVEEEDPNRRGVLTLYHHGAEPDSATYDALQRISREYVAEIYATGRWNERAFEVAEELTGGCLADLGIVAQDSASIRRIVYEVGRALDALAEVGLRHRDIRPGTLLVRNRDPLELVIGSFGSARLSVSDLDIVAPLEITRYTAPEAVAGGVAAASDWWSLGIVLLELITRGACFNGVNQQAFLIHVLASGVPLPDDLPSDLSLLFRGLLAKDRMQRWKWSEVHAWLEGNSPEAPVGPNENPVNEGPSVALCGRLFYTPQRYALAAAEAGHWNESRDQLVRGVLTTWAQDASFAPALIAGLRRIAKQDSLDEDFRLLVALKVLNPDMPPIFRGNIVTPQWLLMAPLEGYELITGPVPEMLEHLKTENWLLRLKERAKDVRNRAQNLAIDLDEDSLRINLLSTSRARLAVEWDERRKLLPDTEHHGLLRLLERRTVSEEDLIVLLSAAISQFRSFDAIVEEARNLASTHGIHQFDEAAAREMVRSPRGEILLAVAERIEGFARCSNTELNEWADEFRLEKRMPLAKALALLSVPKEQWQAPQKQQYVTHIMDFFEKKVVSSVMRGPLVRMTIGKSTPRVDLTELGTPRVESSGILDHLLQRNSQAITLDPAALYNLESTTGPRLQSLERHTQLYKRDTGIDGLYLGFPFLMAKDTKSNSATRIAPLLLWPARVHHEVGTRGKVTVAFDSEREEIRLNPALDAILGPEQTKTWRMTAEEMLGRSTLSAADVIDAFGTLATPRSRKLVPLSGPKTTIPANTLELECSAVLFHMTFIGQAIGEDIRLLKSLPPAGTGLETALRLVNNEEAPEETKIKPREIDRYFTVHSDPSQEEAVLRARSGPGLLVEGPPGTGKSQTIVNMVGDAIGQKRSLLIVCQKHAALEVVHKRLVAEGLGNRIVMVNDVNRDRQPIIRAVREQLEELLRQNGDPANQIRRNREVTAARIESLEGALDKHHEALHQVDDRIGLSYRILLGDLIKLESPSAPINVPALRPILVKLNMGELASLEEELAPLARYWLPARYEGSALSSLVPFTPDQATIADFTKSFEDFAKAESLRAIVITTRQASFEVDDPAPHRTWLSAYGNEMLELPESHRDPLARWLTLFRAKDGEDYPGNKVIEDLTRVRDALAACRETDYDTKISSHLVRMPTKKLEKTLKLAKEALVPVGFWGRLHPFRAMRIRHLHQFLVGLSDTGTTERISALVAAASLEQRWRPLKAALSDAHRTLQLPDLEPDAGPTLLNTTTVTLVLAKKVATYAAHIAKAPWQDRLDTAVLAGTKDAILTLYAEFDAAFARCEARLDSLSALKNLENWMAPDWFAACNEAIGINQANSVRIQPMESALPSLAAYQYFRGRGQQLSNLAVTVFGTLRGKEVELNTVATSGLEGEIRRILNREARLGWMHSMQQAVPELTLERSELETKVAVLEKLDDDMRRLNCELLKEDYNLQAIRPLREWEDITRLTGQRARRLREFIEMGANLGLMKLKPVWLMNPDVASRVLPLKTTLFDTVIYDEASQMPVEFALPSLFRAKVTVVSGDEKQMPPTSFFTSKLENDEAQIFDGEIPDEDATDEERDSFEETWNRREIKDCPDLLELARTSMPSTRLKIHYRSAFRELIDYSNAAFYGNDLSVPVRHPDSVVLSSKPIEMVAVNGVYQEQTNPLEAEKVVDILAELWQLDYVQRPSVGVVTFNRKQADLIEEVLELRAQKDPVFREAYRLESERNEDGEDMGVFVKNVENVQGDEREIIIFSSTFGRNKLGTFLRNFGVLGQKGGERRLNVAVTRSRKKVIMVTSMPIAEISDFLTTRHPPSTPRDFLQGYMEYARAISSGELSYARTLLSRMTVLKETSDSPLVKRAEDGFYHAVGEFLRATGHAVKATEKGDAFALDYAIEHPETGLFALGIECDAPRHALLENARAREIWRTKVLNRAIPLIHRVSSRGWYYEPEQERQRLLDAISRAINMEIVV